MSVKTFYVYEHWRPDRKECFYVGKGNGRRANRLGTSGKRNAHHRAIQDKLSKLGLPIEVKIVAVNLTAEDAYKFEIERISFWINDGADLVNHTDGGEGLKNPSPETREKMRLAKLGKKMTDEARANMRMERKTRVRTTEHNAKIGMANRGRKMAPEHKERLRLINLSIYNSPERLAKRALKDELKRIAKLSRPSVGRRPVTEEDRKRISEGVQRTWDSMDSAAKAARAEKTRLWWARARADGTADLVCRKISEAKKKRRSENIAEDRPMLESKE